MKINVEVVEEKIDALSLQVTDGKLVAYVPNKTCANEVIWLIAAILDKSSVQELKAINSGWSVKVTCDAIDIQSVSEVTIKVGPSCDYISAFGCNKDSVIDMTKSTFSFEP